MGALAADGTITDLEGITSFGLEQKYNPLREQVEDSLKRQELLLNKIKVGGNKLLQQMSVVFLVKLKIAVFLDSRFKKFAKIIYCVV